MKRHIGMMCAIVICILLIGNGIEPSFAANNSETYINMGDNNTQVKELQLLLLKTGDFTYKKATGYFGNKTKEAVVSYQKKNGFEVNGFVTYELLNNIKDSLKIDQNNKSESNVTETVQKIISNDEKIYLEKGDKSAEVRELQLLLAKSGEFTHSYATGYFGSLTKEAVISYQKKNNIETNGTVSTKMIYALRDKFPVETVVSRGGSERKEFGILLDWWTEVRGYLINRGDILVVEDFETGISFNVMVTYGTNHADIESLTLEDTNKILDIVGEFNWERRPVLVRFKGQVIAASMAFMPHAGVDSEPEGEKVNNRSDNYGRGYNFDKVKNNGMEGVVDLHFLNSKKHNTGQKCPLHQAAVLEAAGLN